MNGHSLSKPVVTPWYQVLPRSAIPKLLKGRHPVDMDDKWVITADAPDEHGYMTVHMIRSWTSFKLFELKVKDGNKEKDSLITTIRWESDKEKWNGNEEEVIDTVKTVLRNELDIRLP
jgi:hypothetical protein